MVCVDSNDTYLGKCRSSFWSKKISFYIRQVEVKRISELQPAALSIIPGDQVWNPLANDKNSNTAMIEN